MTVTTLLTSSLFPHACGGSGNWEPGVWGDLPSDLLRPPPCLGAMMESGVAEEGRGYMGWSAAVQFVLSGIVGNQVRL